VVLAITALPVHQIVFLLVLLDHMHMVYRRVNRVVLANITSRKANFLVKIAQQENTKTMLGKLYVKCVQLALIVLLLHLLANHAWQENTMNNQTKPLVRIAALESIATKLGKYQKQRANHVQQSVSLVLQFAHAHPLQVSQQMLTTVHAAQPTVLLQSLVCIVWLPSMPVQLDRCVPSLTVTKVVQLIADVEHLIVLQH